MHKAFRAIERNKDEDSHAFQARVFQEAGGAGDFYTPWKSMGQIVNEGYESPYTFGRMMRQYLGDDNAVIYRFNPTGIYLSFNHEGERAVLYDPALREEEEAPLRAANGPVRDWYDAIDTLAVQHESRPLYAVSTGVSTTAPVIDVTLTCDTCGKKVLAKDAYLPPSVIVEGGGVITTVFCQECRQGGSDDGIIMLTCDGCGRQVSTDDAYMKLLGPEDGVLCPICFLNRELARVVSRITWPVDERDYGICRSCGRDTYANNVKLRTADGGLLCSGCFPAWYSSHKAELTTSQDAEAEKAPYICDTCGREVDAAEAWVDEGVLCPDCYLNQAGNADQE